MRIVVVGGGALGQAYASCLVQAGAELALLEPTSAGPRDLHVVRRSACRARRHDFRVPTLLEAGSHCDLLLVAVRAEQLDGLSEPVLACAAPMVVLPPLMPQQLERLVRARRSAPVVVAMASLLAWRKRETVSYRAAPFTKTLLDDAPNAGDRIVRFAELLRRGGVRARVQQGVAERNQATTTAFFATQLALCAAGGAARLARSPRLLRAYDAANRELRQLAHTLGPIEPGIRLLSRWSTPWQVQMLLGAAGWLVPASTAFLDDHFAVKLRAQHRALASELWQLGQQRGLPLQALSRLLEESEHRDRQP